MSVAPVIPQFLIIGAVKAATTWLNFQLQQCERIFIPKAEPKFFSQDFERGFAWYAGFFRDARPDQLVGEQSADYLSHPLAAQRLESVLPHAPLIAQLRDPVDRAYSDYCMLYRRGTVGPNIEEYLDPRRAEFRRFLDNGLYYQHLVRWQSLFPAEQILVFLFEDVIERPEWTIRTVGRHIGLDEDILPRPGTNRVNDSRAALLPLPVRKLLAPIKDLARPLRGSRWFETLRSSMARQVDYPPFPPELQSRLRDYYACDVGALGKLIGRDLGRWLAEPRAAAA
jgi:hypothetical protein